MSERSYHGATSRFLHLSVLDNNALKGKGMFYLTTHLTHFCILRLYNVGDMVNDLSDKERGNPLPPLYGLRFTLVAARALLNETSPRQGSHITSFVTPIVKHWLEREIVQWVHHISVETCSGDLSLSKST